MRHSSAGNPAAFTDLRPERGSRRGGGHDGPGVITVAVLLPVTGSITPAGGATVAVLTRVPVVAGGTVPVTVKVAVAPTGMLSGSATTAIVGS